MAVISINDVLTNFEQLSGKFKSELLIEYKANRITGDKYAEVYTALMAQSMQQAVGFVIQKQQGDANESVAKANEDLIKQKILTEKAQIQDNLTELVNVTDNQGKVQGSVGKQQAVYDAQIKGFKDDALQKGTKLMTDIWSIQRSTDTGIAPNAENKLFDSNIGSAVETYFNQLGIAQAQPPQVASVQIMSTDGKPTVGINNAVTITGNLGSNATGIQGLSLRSRNGQVVSVITPTPTVDPTSKTFIVDSIDVTQFPLGEIVVVADYTKAGGKVTVNDSILKG